MIAFSTQLKEPGAHCQFPSTLLHKPLNNSVTGATALYEIKLPSSKEEFFICAKKDPDAFKVSRTHATLIYTLLSHFYLRKIKPTLCL